MRKTAIPDFKKHYKKILHQVGRAIEEYNLIEAKDRILVAVSGGKDSLAMLYILKDLQQKAPVDFEIIAYTLDQGQPGFDPNILKKFFEELKVEYHIGYRDTYSIVIEKIPAGKTFCSLCSRLRRGILYTEADRLGANKIALGHHADDAAETLLLNLLYNGRLAAIPPKLISNDGRHTVIRPLIQVDEQDIATLASMLQFPILPCNLCNNQENLERQRIKALLTAEKQRNPIVAGSMKRALANVKVSHLWDKRLQKTDDEIFQEASEALL